MSEKAESSEKPTSTKPRFNKASLDEFVYLFTRQNWRIKERKKPGANIDLIQKDELRGMLSLKSDSDIDAMIEVIAQDAQYKEQYDGICEALAQAIYKDIEHHNVVFRQIFEIKIKDFWFSEDQFNPYLRATRSAFGRISEKYFAQKAADTLSKELSQIKTYVGDNDKQRLKFTFNLRDDSKKEVMSYDVDSVIPEKFLEIADLLENKPHTLKKGDDGFRTSVAYRMREDCAQIVKLASAACDMSATEYVETLILNASHVFVRGRIGKLVDEVSRDQSDYEAFTNLLFGKRIYDSLRFRYQDESAGYFPKSKKTKVPAKGALAGWRPWYPEDDEGPKNFFSNDTTIDEAMDYVTKRLKELKRATGKNSTKTDNYINLLQKLISMDKEQEKKQIAEGKTTAVSEMMNFFKAREGDEDPFGENEHSSES